MHVYYHCTTARYPPFPIFLIHLVQALTFFPLFKFTHCKFGYFLFLVVGLYLLRNFFRVTVTIDFFPQIAQTRDMILKSITKLII